jgi:UDP-N-acetylglucosamine 2-epimerase (non-hydrolysing)
MNRKLAVILGIRPDVIRASVLLQMLHESPECDLHFIWTGQHYSDNLKDVFFRELQVRRPDVELNAGGETDAAVVSNVIAKLAPVLQDLDPAAAVFLGDTNTVMGCVAAAQFNIPVVHIEGCMRSYDWRMPEEKYRTVIDHLSDVIYAYFDEYKQQGIREGLNPENIVVVGNLIVDVLERYYFARKDYYDALANAQFFASRKIERGNYYVMTAHRRENVQSAAPLTAIMQLAGAAPCPVYFLAGYRTQRSLREMAIAVPANLILVDPVGYDDILALIVNSRGVLTDSGTIVEETCVLGVPSVQMRKSTERPQVYDARSSVKFDPAEAERYPATEIYRKLESLRGGEWRHALGDGKSSERIVGDLLRRLEAGDFARHRPELYHLPVGRSYQGDGLD